MKKTKLKHLTALDIDRIIEMAWEDRTPFEAIAYQFDLSENDVKELMRKALKPKSYKLWRKRVNQGISQKHRFKQAEGVIRFRSPMQRQISLNKISKRK